LEFNVPFSTNTAISDISIHNAGLQYAKCNTVAFPVESATVNKLPSQLIKIKYLLKSVVATADEVLHGPLGCKNFLSTPYRHRSVVDEVKPKK